MAKGVNKVFLIGRLGQNPEIAKTAAGATICTISLATSETWKDKQSGQMQERTEWHRVKFFGKLGDVAAQYLEKGSRCYIMGKIITDQWQDQQGQTRYTTYVVAKEMQMLDSKPSGEANGNNGQQQSGNDFGDFDDDVPF